jgi:hypothetical protein
MPFDQTFENMDTDMLDQTKVRFTEAKPSSQGIQIETCRPVMQNFPVREFGAGLWLPEEMSTFESEMPADIGQNFQQIPEFIMSEH